MFETIYGWMLEFPDRVVNLAAGVMMACLALLFTAGIGNVLVLSQSMLHKEPISLAAVFPDTPTWFVPESTVTVVSLLAIAGASLALLLYGRELKRLRNRY